MFYAIVFKRGFGRGAHWTDDLPNPDPGQRRVPGQHRASEDDSDRKQDWQPGDLYSTGTVIGELPSHLEAIELPDAPPEGWVWDRARRRFVAP